MLPATAKAKRTDITRYKTTQRENFTIPAFISLLYLSVEYNQWGEINQDL